MKAADIAARKRELLAELAALDGEDALTVQGRQSRAREADQTTTSSHQEAKSVRSIRDLVLDALDEIGFMTYGQQLAMYVRGRFGREVSPTRFGTLSADEEKAFRRGSTRTVWLCHGLTHDRGHAVKRLWARSDWPLGDRIVTPIFGRAQYLRATARFVELAMKADEFAANSDILRFMAADHARDLGVKVRHGHFELVEWRELAQKQLATIAGKERDLIDKAVAVLTHQLDPAAQLFGTTPRPFVVVEQGLKSA